MQDFKPTHSIWEQLKPHPFSLLTKAETSDVCVVGAGIAGMTIAYELLKANKSVIILKKELCAGGETGLTTAHISNVLDDGYYHLKNIRGLDVMEMAAESHTAAIKKIEEIVKVEKINCDFKKVDGYLFCGENKSEEELQKELIAVHQAGLDVEFLESFIQGDKNLGAALHFKNQAEFHPLKYLCGLHKAILRMGGKIYGGARVTTTQETGSKITVHTADGHSVTCHDLVFATNSPTNHMVAMHTKESAYRSYAIGIKIPKDSVPHQLLWDTEDPYHYVRVQSCTEHDVLIVGGEDHRVGQDTAEENHFTNLKEWCKNRLGISGKMEYKWSGQIIETLDGLAYIGKSPDSQGHVFEVSGDSGHGITHGTIAGMIIPSLILKKKHEWEQVYDPSRFPMAISTYLKENFQGAVQNVDWVTGGDVASIQDIKRGEGAIIREGISKVAVYRDVHGGIHKCSAVCPHLGALVRWNNTEKTWDCPFHGSRFSPTGEVLNGPAYNCLTEIKENRNLEK